MVTCPICQNKTNLFHCINTFTYYSCDHCQTLFLSPRPSATALENYYKKNFYFDNGLINEKDIRNRARIILRQLKKLNPQGETLLDIGSGYGFFLDEAQKTDLTVTGLEPSFRLFEYSNNRNLILNQTFDQFVKKKHKIKYDFITAIHVIEHLDEPKEFLKKVGSLLKKNGILYIETPNLNSHLFRAEKQNYTFLTPPDHLWLFSLNSFRRLLSPFCSSLILNCSRTYSYPEHLMGVIKSKINQRTEYGKQKPENKISNNLPSEQSDFRFQTSNLSNNIKILFFDKLLAQIGTPFLNLGGYGSILELYIKKKT